MEGFPDCACVALLQELKIEYLLVDRSAYSDYDEVMRTLSELGLTLTAQFDSEYVYQFSSD